MTLITQPSALPTRKVAAGTIAGAVTAGLVAALRAYRPDLAEMAGPLIEQLVPVAVAFIASYMTKERAT
jgi:uncharacterized protein YacL